MNTIELNNIKYLQEPYPHCVIDNFFDIESANKIYESVNSLKLENASYRFTDKRNPNEYNKFVTKLGV